MIHCSSVRAAKSQCLPPRCYARVAFGWSTTGGLTRVGNGAYNEVYKESVMRSIGPMELLVILGIAVLLFGGKKIPEVAKGLGEGIRNFKTALKGDDENKPEEKKPV
jgi:sec-independent protein translocase protein TatA